MVEGGRGPVPGDPAEGGRGTLPDSPAGWWALVPGLAQWRWGQRERGTVLAASYLSGLLMAVFAWGTFPGLGLLAFALTTHGVSTADALRQPRFPSLGTRADTALVIWWLLVGLYAPLLSFAAVTAWPGAVLNLRSDSYLINLWVYRVVDPQNGAYVWFRPTRQAEPRLGLVVGRPGQLVGWSEGWLTVDEVRTSRKFPGTTAESLKTLLFRIPEGLLLVRAEPFVEETDQGPMLVDRSAIIGRAWAQSYPVRERRLLRAAKRPREIRNSLGLESHK